ncbi:MAG: hypothetical protein GY854_07070, partial [Deltaproteobacteria bacterium]|nr:hypothetical protein [Deltaproteobacteria bacterium]
MEAWRLRAILPASVLACVVVFVVPGNSNSGEAIRGITLAPIEDTRLGDVGYGSERSAESLEDFVHVGANWVSLTPFGRMDDLDSTEILHDFEIPVERNEDMMRETAAKARELGLKVAIIPHVYVMSGRWRGRIDPGSEERFEEWFVSYDRFVARFAALAEEVGADLFSIGVEFKSTTNFNPERWRKTIALVRSIYSGSLTYSANWDEVDCVEFWDVLDMVGINAFWPLASKPGDGFDTMRERAENVADEIEGLAFYWNRPIVFTEFGVKSARDSALAPWEWPEDCESLVYDETYQAMAYDAVLEAMTRRWWFEGLFIWKYISDPYDETQEAPTGFSPRGKKAETTLSSWFERSWDE